MKILGSCIIGALTALAGFPIYDGTFHPRNLFVVIGCIALWNIIFYSIRRL